MRWGYFPGCSTEDYAKDYDLSLRYVARALGIDLVEIKDWVCCGAFSASVDSHLLSVGLPLFNLSRAETQGFEKIVVPCPVCLSRLKKAHLEWAKSVSSQEKWRAILETPYEGRVKSYHPIELFLELGLERVREKRRRSLSGLKIACYYGCFLTRPPELCSFDRAENPQSLDLLLRHLGAETVDWPLKTACCGNFIGLSRSDLVQKLGNDLLKAAKEAGANALAVACPHCQTNLDMRQQQIQEIYQTRYDLPILYLTQWMGLAFGALPTEVGIEALLTSPREILGARGLI